MTFVVYKSLARARAYLEETRDRYGYRWPDNQIALWAPRNLRREFDEIDLPERDPCFGDPPR